MRKPLNIGMIGYGFMGRAHTNAFRKVGNFFEMKHQPILKAACARDLEKLKAFADTWAYESVETDWRKLVERPDIDVIDICTPNNTHCEIVLAAAAAGKMILCEKPLAMNGPEALRMVEAVEKAGVANMVWYNYRRVPAVTLAHQLIAEGRLGRIFHYRAKFLQDWTINPELPQGGAGLVASGCRRRRQRGHGRFVGPLYRHLAVAQRTFIQGNGDDRNLRQGAQTQSNGEGRKGRNR